MVRVYDRSDSAEDFRGHAGCGVDQARQEAPEPCEQQAAVVADGAEDGVDGVAVMAVEVVSFEQTIGYHVAEHGLDGVPPSHLAADGRREDAAGSGDHDLQSLARDAVAVAAAIDMGAPDRAAGEAGDLSDPGREAVAVMGVSATARCAPRARTACSTRSRRRTGNLEGTELVVLSACETAQGVIGHGEGVYGLVRALRTAGARNVLVTLRTVGDDSAAAFMRTFYSKWLSQPPDKAAPPRPSTTQEATSSPRTRTSTGRPSS